MRSFFPSQTLEGAYLTLGRPAESHVGQAGAQGRQIRSKIQNLLRRQLLLVLKQRFPLPRVLRRHLLPLLPLQRAGDYEKGKCGDKTIYYVGTCNICFNKGCFNAYAPDTLRSAKSTACHVRVI